MTVTIHIKLLTFTAAAWTSSNPVLLSGQQGYESDTGKMKVGDGATPWNSLSYLSGVTSAVTSIFGRVGNVVAQFGDYSFSQISGPLDAGTF